MLAAGRLLVAGNMSVVAIVADGSKRPACRWKPFQSRLATDDELESMFSGHVGIGVLGGRVSGGLEILDFDKPGMFDLWQERLRERNGVVAARVEGMPRISTPAQGRHLYYRCSAIEGNQKLARSAEPFVDCTGKEKDVLIETRGEGGYVLAPPSPSECHKAGVPYKHVAGPPLPHVPTISAEERDVLLDVARSFDERPEPERQVELARQEPRREGERPGDAYNRRTSWENVLQTHGWCKTTRDGDQQHWRRPGKKGPNDVSAVVGGPGDPEGKWLYVHSTNAAPFEAERHYDRFSAYATLNCGGDMARAARDLAAQGYGEQRRGPSMASGPSSPTPEQELADSVESWDVSFWDERPAGAPDVTAEISEPDAQEVKPESLFQVIDAADIYAPLEERKYAVCEVLPQGSVLEIESYGGGSKTWHAVDLVTAVALGQRWLGRFDCTAGRVLYLDFENGSWEMRRRLQAIALGRGVVGPVENMALSSMPHIYMTDARFEAAVRQLAEGRLVIVIDTLRAASPDVDENDSRMRAGIDALRRVGEITGCSFVVLVHSKKSTGNGQQVDARERGRGSSAIFDAADSVLSISYVKGEPLKVCQTKARVGRAIAPFEVTIDDVEPPDSIDGICSPPGSPRGAVVLTASDVPEEEDIGNREFEDRCDKVLAIIADNPMSTTRFVQDRLGGRNGKASAALEFLERHGAIKNLAKGGERKAAAWVKVEAQK